MKIRPVEKENAGSAKDFYEETEKKRGKVINFFKVMGHHPEALTRFASFYGAVWSGELPAKMKEIAYLKTSIQNGCEY